MDKGVGLDTEHQKRSKGSNSPPVLVENSAEAWGGGVRERSLSYRIVDALMHTDSVRAVSNKRSSTLSKQKRPLVPSQR